MSVQVIFVVDTVVTPYCVSVYYEYYVLEQILSLVFLFYFHIIKLCAYTDHNYHFVIELFIKYG